MKKLLIIGTFIIGVFFGCSSGDSDSSFDQRGYSNTDILVSAEWLNDNLEYVKIKVT